MSAPLVSIILPCYNSADFLAATLASLSAQTESDFECIAIDDGSSDRTLQLLNAHAATDARFSVISRANRGLIATLNEGIAAARGTWIARMDADDIAHPQRLQKQLAALAQAGADVCGVGVRFIGGRTGLWLPPTGDAALKAALLFNPPFAHPGVMARASLFKHHGYDAAAPHAEDYALWCAFACAGARFTAVAEALLDYRIHAGQITQTRRDELAATARAVRSAYALHALPANWPDADKRRFASHASPEQPLDVAQWRELGHALLALAQQDPALAPAFASAWIDALVRTAGVGPACLRLFRQLGTAFPPPADEYAKWRRQQLRVLIGDTVYQWAKRWRRQA
ncbi:putative glycosyltransferase EpsE [Andreprevotia sp. IGB-42]|uniref:glycosyltransferase family 2 protein n=1 Tax=Andreprevotia sp. IGB-42 TaxID=2497473 RepID=UPI00135A540A|nr:glycosyltransferase [Andreprevotia sp. IGB-42]KAF0814545.1 putative glycosyltransferase EpsE [Andreprevotia sp. IGB-42]